MSRSHAITNIAFVIHCGDPTFRGFGLPAADDGSPQIRCQILRVRMEWSGEVIIERQTDSDKYREVTFGHFDKDDSSLTLEDEIEGLSSVALATQLKVAFGLME